MAERRTTPRDKTQEPGKASVNPMVGPVDCTISNVGMKGARLTFPRPTLLPKKFELSFASGHRTWVRVVWQRGSTAGVHFETPLRRAAAKPQKLLSRLIGART